MKKLLLFVSLFASLSVAEAAGLYETYDEAAKYVTETGYVVFIYPKGWDKYGEKLCRKLAADKAVKAAAGNAVILLAPIYQDRSEANNSKAKKAMGSLGYPGDMSDISYPAVVFYEKSGRAYATLCGEELMKGGAADVAQSIKKRISAKKKQDELLAKANATSDPEEKSRFYLQSSRVKGIEWPGGLKDAMHKGNPEDKGGCLAALNFWFSIKAGETPQQIITRLQAAVKNPLLSDWQKQQACAVVIGHLRRTLGMMAGGKYIAACAKTMRKLDPKSSLGMAATVVMRDWVREYRYGQGWSPEIIPGSETPLLMQGVPIDKKGTYTVTFKLKTGRDGVMVKSVRLMEGARCVAEDKTARNVTWSQTEQTFTLQVKKNVKKPELEIIYSNPPDGRSSWGDITVQIK